nr:venom peptide [Acharia stimulea]
MTKLLVLLFATAMLMQITLAEHLRAKRDFKEATIQSLV